MSDQYFFTNLLLTYTEFTKKEFYLFFGNLAIYKKDDNALLYYFVYLYVETRSHR